MIERLPAFESTIGSLLPDWPPLPADERLIIRRHCADFARGQIARAPAHIRWGLRTLLFAFVTFATLRAFARPTTWADSGAALVAFSSLGPPACAGLERVLRSMTLLAFLEHPAVVAAVGEDPAS
jgi:hypothetical protein